MALSPCLTEDALESYSPNGTSVNGYEPFDEGDDEGSIGARVHSRRSALVALGEIGVLAGGVLPARRLVT